MSSSRGRQQETNLQNQAQAAQDTAAQVNPIQQAEQARILHFNQQRDSGTDVGSIDAMRPYMNLYNNATRDGADETGVGLLGNNALAGSNGRLATLIGEQQKSRRQEQASGDLYDAFNQTQQEATGEGNIIANADTNQRMGLAGLANQRYTSYVNRPQRTPLWAQLLQGGMAAAGSAGY